MRRDLAALANTEFDLLVIGGGILGAGVARDAARRGLRVGLVDQADFASGTSSRSTKMIHGGFRYLERAAFGLVAESCRERHILRQLAPHLVKPRPLLFTVYQGDPHPLPLVRVGMTLYDLFARGRAPSRHRSLSAADAMTLEPGLSPEGLRGAVRFHDCQADDDARFCIDNIHHAATLGAVCANYCAVTGFVSRGDRLEAATVVDQRTGDGFAVRARLFINAGGPWADKISRLATDSSAAVRLSITQGVHLVLPRITGEAGVFFRARRDGRLLFAIPWGGVTLVGSTDTDYTGDPAAARTTAADVEYLLTELDRVLPGAVTGPADIITAFAGVRPLLASGASPSARSREHQIVRQGANLLSVAGGKYTTYRAIAEHTLEAAGRVLGQRLPACQTATTPLPRFAPAATGALIADAPPVHEGDIAFACDEEMALTVTDVMRRRTRLALSPHGGRDTAAQVARLMAGRLGWDPAREAGELAAYLEERQSAKPRRD
ncbi:glycerol-3-phosphate dehydrogenase/oxidase [bacterium]|nr:glycerol-3-phosphate dehydrogenase/oxidase [bacterium]